MLRCDDDLTPRPGLLAGHLARHRERPAGAAPLGVISMTRDVFPETPYAAAYGRPANERLLAQAYSRPAEERWQHWAACNSVPRSAYEAVGGFDPGMAYREDSELGLRLARSGVELVIDPALEIEHRGPAPDAETRVSRAFTSGASTAAFDERHPGHACAGRRPLRRLGTCGVRGREPDRVAAGRRRPRSSDRLPAASTTRDEPVARLSRWRWKPPRLPVVAPVTPPGSAPRRRARSERSAW